MRLIDAELVLKTIPSEETISRMIIASAPTVETKQGHWEHPKGWDDNKYRCSACHYGWGFFLGGPKENGANYCPHCGAKMLDEVADA